jgi:signal peptidase I
MAKPGKSDKRDSSRQPEAPPVQAPQPARASSFALLVQWLLSRTVRHARAMCKHVRKTLNHQRDILKPNAIEQVQAAVRSVEYAVATKADRAILTKQMENLDKAAQDWLKPYPSATLRENVEVLLVALAVAMAVRTFFLQPFKIPTASMQPTLFGVTSQMLKPDFVIPTGLDRIKQWLHGASYLHIVAEEDGEFLGADEPLRFLIFSIRQRLNFAGKTMTIWFPPDYGSQTLEQRAGIHPRQFFHKGEDIVKVQIDAGDHLFVNRLTYNFRRPERGEIVVFETHGITQLDPSQQDTFYIKRLVGFGGETLTIQPEYELRGTAVLVGRLVVDGKPLSASTPHFEALYSFSGVPRGTRELQYEENHYYGHALLSTSGPLPPSHEFHVDRGNYFVMGDNTLNSSDSRFWGGVPQQKVIGKSFFVYWPLTDRFGWGQR